MDEMFKQIKENTNELICIVNNLLYCRKLNKYEYGKKIK